MKQSLDILKEIPQFQDNQRQLMLYQDRLEGMTRPHLLAAFNKHETGAMTIDDTISRVFGREPAHPIILVLSCARGHIELRGRVPEDRQEEAAAAALLQVCVYI
jgi:hypothetical protein